MAEEVWTPQAVVLGAGNYPSHHIPLALMRECPRVVCCDGAAQEYIQNEGRLPWRIVGDGDSIPAGLKTQCRDILFLEAEQETNDQTKATRLLRSEGIIRIAYLGATGKREDHTIGNIALLLTYRRMGLDVRMFTDHGMFLLPCAENGRQRITFSAPVGTAVSVWNFGAKNLNSAGLQYRLYDFDQLWQGTLNRTLLPQCSIEADGNFLVFLAYEER